MSDDHGSSPAATRNFDFDIQRDGGDVPAFIEGKRVEIVWFCHHVMTGKMFF